MKTQTRRCKVPPFELLGPTGDAVALSAIRLAVTRIGDSVVECRLEFLVDAATWARIDREAWFHLDPELRGATSHGGFDPGVDLEIEARLDDSLLHPIDLADHIYDVGALFLDAGLEDPVLQTESWYALYVKQRLGPVKAGFATSHVR